MAVRRFGEGFGGGVQEVDIVIYKDWATGLQALPCIWLGAIELMSKVLVTD
jgi:hypothetical protein